MKTNFLLAVLVVGACGSVWSATPLTESTFTEIIREANVVAATSKSTTPAVTNMIFHAPDLVRTGPASRVEMTAPDQTITRVGANTVFTFEPGGRNIQLEKGSVLFHPPTGVGGGTVKYRGTAAAVLGTTMVCVVYRRKATPRRMAAKAEMKRTSSERDRRLFILSRIV